MKKRFNKRPLSWSQLSSFTWDKEQWYQSYILGNRTPANKQMLFGSKIGKMLELDPNYLSRQIPRLGTMEYAYAVKFNGFRMIGYADSQNEKTNTEMDEYKTGVAPWTQKRVDEHGQLTMYAMMNMIQNQVQPEDLTMRLYWLPTAEQGDFSIDFAQPFRVERFETKRTMQQVIAFGAYINRTIKEMDEYINSK